MGAEEFMLTVLWLLKTILILEIWLTWGSLVRDTCGQTKEILTILSLKG